MSLFITIPIKITTSRSWITVQYSEFKQTENIHYVTLQYICYFPHTKGQSSILCFQDYGDPVM
jgi:hypothetical protein